MQTGTSYKSPADLSKSPSTSILEIQDRESGVPLSATTKSDSQLSPRIKFACIIIGLLIVVGGACIAVYFVWFSNKDGNDDLKRVRVKSKAHASLPNSSAKSNSIPIPVAPNTSTSTNIEHVYSTFSPFLPFNVFCRTPSTYSSVLATATKADIHPSSYVRTFDQIWPYKLSFAQQNPLLYIYPEDTRVAVMKGDITSISGAFIVNSVSRTGLIPSDDHTSMSFKIHEAADGDKLSCKRQKEEMGGSFASSLNRYILDTYPVLDPNISNIHALPGTTSLTSDFRLITTGCFLTPPRYLVANGIVHACGPDCREAGENSNRVTLLYWTIYNILSIVDSVQGHKVVIPLISIGNNAYPDRLEHAAVYLAAIRDYFDDMEKNGKSPNIQRVMICIYDQNTFKQYVDNMKQVANHLDVKRTPESVIVTCHKK